MAIISQDQYNVVKQRYRKILIKINLLNFNFQVVDSIEGNLTTGNITINANSDIRRSCNITMVVKNNTFQISAGGQIWLDKYIQIYYGIVNNINNEVVWTNMGIFLINNPNHVYDSVNNTITFQGVDLMAKLTGIRNGYFEWLNGVIPQQTDEENGTLRDIFIDLLEQAGFTKYNIENLVYINGEVIKLPYDVEISATSTLYDVFNEIRNNVLPNYEMFFDIDGVFNLKKIYNSASDPIIIDNDVFNKTVMNITNDINFENVKNAIEIWGQTLEPVYGNPVCTIDSDSQLGDVWFCEITEIKAFETIPENSYIGFGIRSSVYTQTSYLYIDGFQPYQIVDENNEPVYFEHPEIGSIDYYIVVFESEENGGHFKLIGNQQVYCYIEDDIPESPFYVNGNIGKILLPLSGGEYDIIQTKQQAYERALYELYNYARMNDSIRLTSVIIPWADVNQKIEYINEDAEISGIFIIKNISMNLDVGGVMTLECMRWYDYEPDKYPWEHDS